MPLKDITLRSLKAREKSYKVSDEKGLFLLVTPAGSKCWRLKYRFNGKEKTLSFGVYPDISLAQAREARDNARKSLADNTDPSLAKKIAKQTSKNAASNSFEAVAREWHLKYSARWTSNHSEKIIRRFERDIFPWIGQQPISELNAPALLTVLRRIESRGAIDTAHRAHQNCSQVFRYAIATGRAERDPAADLRGALPPVRQQHHPSITDPKLIGKLLNDINYYQGSYVSKCALQLAPLLFVRPGELRKAEWSEINFDTAEWRIPAEKMKMRTMHIVSLSTQAIAILRELYNLTGKDKYIFPCMRTKNRPMSENTINSALRRLGYSKDEMTAHGFRSMASTILNEQGWNRDVIERQLAHAERNTVRAAYNYAEHLPERRKMMQAWADYLSTLGNINISVTQGEK